MKYTIQKGDTLSGIARDFLGDASRGKELAIRNGIRDPNKISPGTVIHLYDGDRLLRRGPLGKLKDWLWGE